VFVAWETGFFQAIFISKTLYSTIWTKLIGVGLIWISHVRISWWINNAVKNHEERCGRRFNVRMGFAS
jgi:hypothetical protein